MTSAPNQRDTQHPSTRTAHWDPPPLSLSAWTAHLPTPSLCSRTRVRRMGQGPACRVLCLRHLDVEKDPHTSHPRNPYSRNLLRIIHTDNSMVGNENDLAGSALPWGLGQRRMRWHEGF